MYNSLDSQKSEKSGGVYNSTSNTSSNKGNQNSNNSNLRSSLTGTSNSSEKLSGYYFESVTEYKHSILSPEIRCDLQSLMCGVPAHVYGIMPHKAVELYIQWNKDRKKLTCAFKKDDFSINFWMSPDEIHRVGLLAEKLAEEKKLRKLERELRRQQRKEQKARRQAIQSGYSTLQKAYDFDCALKMAPEYPFHVTWAHPGWLKLFDFTEQQIMGKTLNIIQCEYTSRSQLKTMMDFAFNVCNPGAPQCFDFDLIQLGNNLTFIRALIRASFHKKSEGNNTKSIALKDNGTESSQENSQILDKDSHQEDEDYEFRLGGKYIVCGKRLRNSASNNDIKKVKGEISKIYEGMKDVNVIDENGRNVLSSSTSVSSSEKTSSRYSNSNTNTSSTLTSATSNSSTDPSRGNTDVSGNTKSSGSPVREINMDIYSKRVPKCELTAKNIKTNESNEAEIFKKNQENQSQKINQENSKKLFPTSSLEGSTMLPPTTRGKTSSSGDSRNNNSSIQNAKNSSQDAKSSTNNTASNTSNTINNSSAGMAFTQKEQMSRGRLMLPDGKFETQLPAKNGKKKRTTQKRIIQPDLSTIGGLRNTNTLESQLITPSYHPTADDYLPTKDSNEKSSTSDESSTEDSAQEVDGKKPKAEKIAKKSNHKSTSSRKSASRNKDQQSPETSEPFRTPVSHHRDKLPGLSNAQIRALDSALKPVESVRQQLCNMDVDELAATRVMFNTCAGNDAPEYVCLVAKAVCLLLHLQVPLNISDPGLLLQKPGVRVGAQLQVFWKILSEDLMHEKGTLLQRIRQHKIEEIDSDVLLLLRSCCRHPDFDPPIITRCQINRG